MRTLFVIPARSGSKRLPNKNKRILNEKPLVSHSIDFAKKVAKSDDIVCVTSDDTDILAIAEDQNVEIIIDRPKYLAEDTSTTFDVLSHALEFVNNQSPKLECLVLLQPTTPFRCIEDFREMMNIFLLNQSRSVISVSGIKADTNNRVRKSININGSIYIYSIKRVLQSSSLNLNGSIFFEMSDKYSIDIDTMEDWEQAEELI